MNYTNKKDEPLSKEQKKELQNEIDTFVMKNTSIWEQDGDGNYVIENGSVHFDGGPT